MWLFRVRPPHLHVECHGHLLRLGSPHPLDLGSSSHYFAVLVPVAVHSLVRFSCSLALSVVGSCLCLFSFSSVWASPRVPDFRTWYRYPTPPQVSFLFGRVCPTPIFFLLGLLGGLGGHTLLQCVFGFEQHHLRRQVGCFLASSLRNGRWPWGCALLLLLSLHWFLFHSGCPITLIHNGVAQSTIVLKLFLELHCQIQCKLRWGREVRHGVLQPDPLLCRCQIQWNLRWGREVRHGVVQPDSWLRFGRLIRASHALVKLQYSGVHIFLPLLPKFLHLSWIHDELRFFNRHRWPHSTHNHTGATLVANEHSGRHVHRREL